MSFLRVQPRSAAAFAVAMDFASPERLATISEQTRPWRDRLHGRKLDRVFKRGHNRVVNARNVMSEAEDKPVVDPHAPLVIEPVSALMACLRFTLIALVVMGAAYACVQTLPPPLGPL
jgi:hypothetical protein